MAKDSRELPQTGLVATEPPTRWALIRDIAVFQLRLVIDAARDVVMSPISLGAGLFDLVTGGDRPGDLFYRVLRAGRQTERFINLFGEAERVGPHADEPEDAASIDQIVERVERMIVEQYERGGVTASAKSAIDRSLDALPRRRPR